MSQGRRSGDRAGQSESGSGLEALQESSAFRGPAESLDEHEHANDHLALIYESREEQFATAIPFIRQGIDRGEQCVYVVDDNDRDDVLCEMRGHGIDVDDALESGALSVVTPEETYRRTGEFDQDAMVEFWEATLDRAKDDDFAGLRAAAEMTWALDGTPLDDLTEYEAILNPLYDGEDYTVLCQYNRERFPPGVINDVIETHPHLITENTVFENIYYTPPERLAGHDDLALEVDRKMQSLRERTEAKAELADHKQYLRNLYEITATNDLSFEEAVERLLELGCERFDLRGGALSHLPTLDSDFRAEVTVGPEIGDREGIMSVQPTAGCFCRQAITWDEPTAISDVVDAGWDDGPLYREFGLETYFGMKVTAGSEPYGTLWFYDTSPRDGPFTEDERTFLELMGQWVSNELERVERERFQRRLYEVASDTDMDFDEKLEAVFELGCDRFDVEYGGMATVDVDADLFEPEVMNSEHDHLVPGEQYPLSETYCEEATETSGTAAITDPVADGYEGKLCYDRFGVRAYLGTHLELDGDDDRTFFFLSNEERDTVFTEADHTALRLMGQWVQYELERQRHERNLEATVDQLQKSNDRLAQFAYSASHDLQEPLRMVSSYLQLLENNYSEALDADAREYIDFAVEGADRMRAMIDDLLAFSRVEQADETFEPVDCDAVLERVEADLALQVEETDAEIRHESLPTVTADGEQLEQLFGNLVSNALKYTGDDTPHVEIAVDDNGDHWEFSVIDDGIGIDPEKTDRIFELFKRLHHEDEYPGTGIGLSLCQEIVENHSGEIWVDSEPGEGSTFSFTLPKRRENNG